MTRSLVRIPRSGEHGCSAASLREDGPCRGNTRTVAQHRRAPAWVFFLVAAAGFGPGVAAQQPEDAELIEMTRAEWVQLIDERIAEQRQAPPPAAARNDAMIAQGQAAFMISCTECHEANRSLDKRKSFAGWVATVRRMALKDGAEVSAGDVEPIAAYLASLGQPEGGEVAAVPTEAAPVPTTSAFATLSSVWRGTNDEQPLENPGFFVDAWLGADWQPEGPLSARVVGCTSCHADRNSSAGFSLELVEASATLDLTSMICGCGDAHCKHEHDSPVQANVKAGRFIVPFGAFSAMSYPGVYRTVTNPLMFNMGRRVGSLGPLQPVLPMPYSDEGVDAHLSLSLTECWTATMDAYAVNGLQDASPQLFNSSRSYMDNNREPAVGGRVTVGNKVFRLGGSLMTGNLSNNGSPAVPYKISGVDATLRVHERLRAYFEYAIREDDSTFVPGRENYAYGIVAELEARLHDDLSFVTRYDTLEHRHTAFGNSSVERITYGLNADLPGGSVLALNHEHWLFTGSDVDVLGVRWTATF